jgi:Ran GTPase-activating protein (RanGAP) involved in mRNA processing and transport
VLAPAIAVCASITSVNVLSNMLDVESADLLLKVKAEKPNLRTLCGLTHVETKLVLEHSALGPGDAKLLSPEILVMASVTKVLVSYNLLGAAGATVLCDALRESKVTNVQELDLQYNGIGPEGAKAVAAMAAVVASVTKVLVGSNGLGDEGTTILCDALRESKVTKVQELDLSWNGIGPDGARAVAAMAGVIASLTSVSTAHNKITGDGAQQLASAVLAKPTLENFSGIPLKGLRADSLAALDLSGKGLGVPEAMVLADLLRSVTASLTRLDVRYNSLGEEGTAVLRTAVEGRSGFELKL